MPMATTQWTTTMRLMTDSLICLRILMRLHMNLLKKYMKGLMGSWLKKHTIEWQQF